MNISDHVWGASIGQDRVWAQVVGLPEDSAGKRLLMVWQAYVDESIDKDLIVLAGYIASAESWVRFSSAWEGLLKPFGVLGSDGRYRFKMSEMALNSERLSRVQTFYRAIEDISPLAISMTMQVGALEAARKRVLRIHRNPLQISGVEGPIVDNEYIFAFMRLVESFYEVRDHQEIIDLFDKKTKIDFIFDDRGEKRAILSSWDLFLSSVTDRDKYGATPRFENDDEFLPLQAADLLAWWVRKHELNPDNAKIFPWETKPFRMMRGIITEDMMTQHIITIAKISHPDAHFVDKNSFVTSALML